MNFLTKDSLLKLDTALCLGYSFSMLFLPTILTSVYLLDEANETTLHVFRSFGGTMLSVGLCLYASIGKSDKQQTFILQSRSLMWFTMLLSCVYNYNLYNSLMFYQGMSMCGLMTLMTAYYGFMFEESTHKKKKGRYRRQKRSRSL